MSLYKEVLRIRLLFSILTLMTGCGRNFPAPDSQVQLATNPQIQAAQQEILDAQTEIYSVVNETTRAIFQAIAPDAAAPTPTSLASCKPNFGIAFVGVNIKFKPTNGCNLSGQVAVKLFPLRAVADIDVVGLQFVRKINFDAEIKLGQGNGVTDINLEILDGNIAINLPSFGINGLTMNAQVDLLNNSQVFALDSRVNAFLSNNGFGASILAELQTNKRTGLKDNQTRACMLSGGVGTNVNAGDTKSCINLFN